MNRQQRRAAERRGEGPHARPKGWKPKEEHEYDGSGALVVAWLDGGQVEGAFATSLASLLLADGKLPPEGRRIVRDGGGFMRVESSPRVAETRNRVVDSFLRGPAWSQDDGKRSEWLLMVDSDMVFEPDAVYKLLEVADPTERPLVGGLCFVGSGNWGVKMYPTIYREVGESTTGGDDADHLTVEPIDFVPQERLVQCGATGAAFLLMHIGLLLRMGQPWPDGYGTFPDGKQNRYPWFQEGLRDKAGHALGEDVAFCRKARRLGAVTHVRTDAVVGHCKQVVLDPAFYEAWKAGHIEKSVFAP